MIERRVYRGVDYLKITEARRAVSHWEAQYAATKRAHEGPFAERDILMRLRTAQGLLRACEEESKS